MFRFAMAFIVCLGAAGILAADVADANLAPTGSKPAAVVVFGDSLTAGSALPKEQRAQVWPAVVERASSGKLRLLNEGKGGRPTDSVRDFEQMLTRHERMDILIVALGTNDSRDITAECVPKAVSNLRKMVEIARKKHGAELRVLLVGPPNVNEGALVATKPIAKERQAKLTELGEAFATLARELGCEYVSLFGMLPATTLAKDGVHPDADGNAAIARVLGEKLNAMAP